MGNSQSFKIWMPATAVKSGKNTDGTRWIQGVASTNHLDLQNEKVDQKGLDFSYFLKNGVFNDDHQQGPKHEIGEPTEAKITSEGMWVKGFLYKNKEKADEWWEHFRALECSGSNRKPGFSIEGRIKKKEGTNIKECWIKNIAITSHPVNTHTWAEIAKSLSGSDIVEGTEDDEKSLSAGSMGGQAMSPESLEGSNKITTYKSIASVPLGVSLSRDEYTTIVQLEHGYSRATAKAVVDAIFIDNGVGLD